MNARMLGSALAFVIAALSFTCSSSSSGGGSSGGQCENKEPGTSFSPCQEDSDCFGSYCDLTGKPAPYCHVPGSTQVNQLHGITCSDDAECENILPTGAAESGIVAKCQGRSNLDPAVCQYWCDPNAPGGGGTGGGTGGGPSGGGTGGTGGGTGGGPSGGGTGGTDASSNCSSPAVFNCGTSSAGTLPCPTGKVCCVSPGCDPSAPDPYVANGAVSNCVDPVTASGTNAQCAAPAIQLCKTAADCGPGYLCDAVDFYCVPNGP